MIKIPVSTSPALALSRVLDNVPRGYVRYTKGSIKVDKLEALASKFSAKYAIGASPAQRHRRKKKGLANALLVTYLPPNSALAEWVLLFTAGELSAHENLLHVEDKKKLTLFNYELVRHAWRGKTAWTWRRTAEAQAGLYGMLIEQCNRKRWKAVKATLEAAARSPGFHGVRGQNWLIQQEAKKRGYVGDMPFLFYMQKIAHKEYIYVP